jgi:hypothetical protein
MSSWFTIYDQTAFCLDRLREECTVFYCKRVDKDGKKVKDLTTHNCHKRRTSRSLVWSIRRRPTRTNSTVRTYMERDQQGMIMNVNDARTRFGGCSLLSTTVTASQVTVRSTHLYILQHLHAQCTSSTEVAMISAIIYVLGAS